MIYHYVIFAAVLTVAPVAATVVAPVVAPVAAAVAPVAAVVYNCVPLSLDCKIAGFLCVITAHFWLCVKVVLYALSLNKT